MKISNKLLSELQTKLKVENRRSALLNSLPTNRSKLDVRSLDLFRQGVHNELINAMMSQDSFKIEISPDREFSEEEIKDKVTLENQLNYIISQKETAESEKAVNPLGIGFPLIKMKSADGKSIVAPLFIWRVNLINGRKVSSFQLIKEADDEILFNDVFKNYLYSELKYALKFDLNDYLNEDGSMMIEQLAKALYDILIQITPQHHKSIHDYEQELTQLIQSGLLIDNDNKEESKNNSGASVLYTATLALYNIQMQSIVQDYDRLIEEATEAELSLDSDDSLFDFQPITSCRTDPSQQDVLESIGSTKNIIIQGPPGTGKSQTLSAILVNALQNDKKTLVVCEKKTALDVLYDTMVAKGLGDYCIMIQDPTRDRNRVVDRVRDKNHPPIIDSDNGNDDNVFIKTSQQVMDAISGINNGHQLLNKRLVGSLKWSDIVCHYLSLKDQVTSHLDIYSIPLSCNPEEYNEIITLLNSGEDCCKKYATLPYKPFINTEKFTGDNPYKIQNDLLKAISTYQSKLEKYTKILNDNEIGLISGDLDSPSWLESFIAIFSGSKKRRLKVLDNVRSGINELRKEVKREQWFTDLNEEKDLVDFYYHLQDLCKMSQNIDMMAEYKYYQFYMPLDPKNKRIIDVLRSYDEAWEPLFSKFYFERILLDNANINIPHNDENYLLYEKWKALFDKQQIDYIQRKWNHQRQITIKQFKKEHEFTIENLYNKRKSKYYKRLSLREIIERDTSFFTNLFPIIFTTPNTASNLFPYQQYLFDIVLLDEASQLRAEETLPVLFKGKRVIISGDEHQMPPSNYFTQTIEGIVGEYDKDDDEVFDRDEILLSTSSLLDFANECNFDKHSLDFHYRSKHPLLIEFSNHAFYEGKLYSMPESQNYAPISYQQIHGLYSDRTNNDEAQAIIRILQSIKRKENGEMPSVGIATFNAPQRDLVIKEILKVKENNPEMTDHFNALTKSGLFIKNLENIQGEERDIILISTTFGVNEDGQFRQVFGPINQDKGYKLLNVIITRAKKKIHVCTSIPDQYISNWREELTLNGSNNKRALLYTYLAYAKAVSEGNTGEINLILETLLQNNSKGDQSKDSKSIAFVDYIYNKNKKNGAKLVRKNIKQGGFNIDVLVEMNDGQQMIIDCDGTAHKDSPLAYLHDIHQEKIMKAFGFNYIRLWSFNEWQRQALGQSPTPTQTPLQ